MIGLNRKLRVFAWAYPIDMRKSFWTLTTMVEAEGHQIINGDVFLFISKNRRRCKVLWFDGTGLIILAKIMEQGQFAPLWERAKLGNAQLSASELSVFLEGNQNIAKGSIVSSEFISKSGATNETYVR